MKNQGTFRFTIHYKTEHSLALVGDSEQTGLWDPTNSVRLQRGGDDVWAITLIHPKVNLQYKYIVLDQSEQVVRWEAGKNRCIDLSCLQPDSIIHEVWEFNIVKFQVYIPETQQGTVCITGNDKGLGNWSENYAPMVLGNTVELPTGAMGQVWEAHIPHAKLNSEIVYKYLLKFDRYAQFEREPPRKLTITQSYQTVLDMNFVSEISIFEVNVPAGAGSLFFGPYPQGVSDVDELIRKGITAIVDLQTEWDKIQRSIDVSVVQDTFGDNRIHAPIQDFSQESLIAIVPGILGQVEQLYKNNEKIYVHWTAGMGRAPFLIVAFLISKLKFSSLEAINLVKSARPGVYINSQTVEHFAAKYQP